MKFVGIDIGSTSIKAAVFDMERRTIQEAHRMPSPARSTKCRIGEFQVPAEEYYQIVKRLIDSVAEHDHDLVGVVLSTQMHGFVIDNLYISWQDTRCVSERSNAESYLEYLKRRIPPRQLARCGVQWKASLGLANLYTLLERNALLNTHKEIFTLGSYLIFRLTGNNICHISNAAPLGFVDLPSRQWRQDILSDLGIEKLALPRIATYDFHSCGHYEYHGRKISIFPDYGDQQISVSGSGAQPSDAIFNIATAGQSIVFSNNFEFESGNYELRPYFNGRFIKVVSNLASGRNLDVIVRFFAEITKRVTGKSYSVDDVHRVIQAGPVYDAKGLHVNPLFFPTTGKDVGGSISGIKEDNLNMDTILTATYQYISESYLHALCSMTDLDSICSIVCAGTVPRKNLHLMNAIERAVKKSCRLSEHEDEALWGLLKAAAQCAASLK